MGSYVTVLVDPSPCCTKISLLIGRNKLRKDGEVVGELHGGQFASKAHSLFYSVQRGVFTWRFTPNLCGLSSSLSIRLDLIADGKAYFEVYLTVYFCCSLISMAVNDAVFSCFEVRSKIFST